jgi:RimJ/RimL family protein N-acetyltransferase
MTVVLADNQERVALLLEKTAGVKCVGRSGPGLQQRLREHYAEIGSGKPGLLETYGNRLSGLVDAWGVDRVLNKPAFDSGINLYCDRLRLRAVRMDDADILLDWANDEETRRGSFNSAVIDPMQHIEWLERCIADPGCLFLLAELDGVPCGEIRYDAIQSGEVLMSFTVAPSFRGMGLSSTMAESSLVAVLDRFGESVIRAYSLPDNIRAQAALVKVGFIFNDAVTEYMGIPCHVSSRTVKRKDLV